MDKLKPNQNSTQLKIDLPVQIEVDFNRTKPIWLIQKKAYPKSN